MKSFKKHGLSEKRRGDLKNEAGYGNQKRRKETRGAINEQLRDPGKFRVLDLNLLMFDESVCVCVILWLDSFGGWILIFFTVTYIDLVECTVEVMFSFFGNITFGITASAMLDMDLISDADSSVSLLSLVRACSIPPTSLCLRICLRLV